MYVHQLIFSFIVFGCLLFLMDDNSKEKVNENNNSKANFDKDLVPIVGKNDTTVVKITFCILSITIIYYFYDQQNNFES